MGPVFLLTRRLRRRRMRRAAALVTVLALVTCSLGVPLPLRVEKAPEVPYPCQGCSCGCVNAEMCWQNCCCFSHEQKLAWAEKNGITPPPYVLAAAKQRACCRDKATATCCTQPKRSCCSGRATCCSAAGAGPRPAATSVVLFQALRCRGLTSLLTSLPPSVVRSGTDPVEFQPQPAGTVVILDVHYTSPCSGPEPPPPQFS
ncbi:MAG: hypothetical protein MI725_00280 [Pirellulales bacterium]|nr:hypothetical protein [Pirellulales bacterium]